MSARDGLLLGLDVGGTKIAGIAVDARSGEVRATQRMPLDDRAPLDRQVATMALGLVDAADAQSPAAVGIAVPGLVDAGSGGPFPAQNEHPCAWTH